MPSLAWLDLAVIGVYLAALVAIGWRASRRIHSQEDYLLGGRRFGWLTQTCASFGQATSADGPVGATATTFVNGASGIWSSLLLLFATPVFWITSPWHRRLRLVTMGDFFEDRYGSKRMAATYAVVATFGMMALIALGFTAMTTTIAAMAPKAESRLTADEAAEVADAAVLAELRRQPFDTLGEDQVECFERLSAQRPRRFIPAIDPDYVVWGICLLVIAYTVAGGLEAAFYTDMLQGGCILFLSIVLVPTAWAKINTIHGGVGAGDALKTIHAELPQHYFDAFGSPAAVDFTWYYVLAASLMAGVTVVVQPNQMLTNSAAKDEFAARFGFMTGVVTKRLCTVLWGVFALAAILLYSESVSDPDIVWGYAARDLLAPGLFGMMVAGMLAALMSTADTLALTCTGLLVRNFYEPITPGRQESHYIAVGRVLSAAILIGSAALATRFVTILEIIRFILEFFVIFAPAFWLGLKWRRATAAGAWASIVVALAAFYVVPLLLPMARPSMYQAPWLVQQTASRTISAKYTAGRGDAQRRSDEIAAWVALDPPQRAGRPRPEPLAVGDTYEVIEVLPPRGVFWSGGVTVDSDGVLTGAGYLYPEMIALHAMGFDLTKNPHPLNESIRVLLRLTLSFVALAAVSLVTTPVEAAKLDRFFLKMRVEVRDGGERDAERLAAAYADPSLADRRLLFEGGDWEFQRWTRTDTLGFLTGVAVVALIAAVLVAVVNAGG